MVSKVKKFLEVERQEARNRDVEKRRGKVMSNIKENRRKE